MFRLTSKYLKMKSCTSPAYAAPRMGASIVPAMTKHFILLSCHLIVKRNTVKKIDKNTPPIVFLNLRAFFIHCSWCFSATGAAHNYRCHQCG